MSFVETPSEAVAKKRAVTVEFDGAAVVACYIF